MKKVEFGQMVKVSRILVKDQDKCWQIEPERLEGLFIGTRTLKAGLKKQFEAGLLVPTNRMKPVAFPLWAVVEAWWPGLSKKVKDGGHEK